MIYFWIALGVAAAAVWIFVGLGIIWIYEDDRARNPDVTQWMVYRWAITWPIWLAFYVVMGLWFMIEQRRWQKRERIALESAREIGPP